MDAELELLLLENARLRKYKDQILTERNQHLSQFQQERTRNTEMSNNLLALNSAINDLKRTNQDLSERLQRAESAKASRTSLQKGMKVEAPSPTLAEEQPTLQEETEHRSLDENDSDADPFTNDFKLLQQEDAPRTSEDLKRKRNSKETTSCHIVRPCGSSSSASPHPLPHRSKPASEPSSSLLRHAAQNEQLESNEEEYSDEEEGDKSQSSPTHSSASYIVPRKRGCPPNSSLVGHKRLKDSDRYLCPVPGCTTTFTRSNDISSRPAPTRDPSRSDASTAAQTCRVQMRACARMHVGRGILTRRQFQLRKFADSQVVSPHLIQTVATTFAKWSGAGFGYGLPRSGFKTGPHLFCS
ncbi:hypothetical protein CPB85DRAFT_1256617 [Mucidula mucida]|nr:hypothetical protein CPB85DRAFT_1256617 [Mucidula mucida]